MKLNERSFRGPSPSEMMSYKNPTSNYDLSQRGGYGSMSKKASLYGASRLGGETTMSSRLGKDNRTIRNLNAVVAPRPKMKLVTRPLTPLKTTNPE